MINLASTIKNSLMQDLSYPSQQNYKKCAVFYNNSPIFL